MEVGNKKVQFKMDYDEEKLKAIRLFLEKKHVSLEEELSLYLDKLYEKNVPKDVKMFIENSIVKEENLNENS